MVRVERQHGPWATLAALTALLLALAALQYRWIGDLGRAEAESRRTQIERSAFRFASALDRELGRAMPEVHFQARPGRDLRAMLLERLAAKARNEPSPLVTRVLVAYQPPAGEVSLQACAPDGSRCHPIPWTPALERFRQRLGPGAGEAGAVGSFLTHPGEFLEEPLAVVSPLMEELDDQPAAGTRWARSRVRGFTVVELDRSQLGNRILPQIAETYFGPLHESEFIVAVLRRSDRSTVYTSDASVSAAELQQGEVVLPLPPRRRPGVDDRRGPVRRAADGSVVPDPGSGAASTPSSLAIHPAPPFTEAPWQLVVRHRGGSLDEAIAAVRRRNFAVGLGVLTLLGAAAVMLAVGGQRARALARQKLEFVASVTHELNTPLAAIRSAGQNLADGIVKDPAQVRRYGGLIEQEGSRLTALVAQVLDFAGIDSGVRAYAREPVALPRVIADVLADLRLVLEQSGVEVRSDLPADLPEVRGDAAALRRVLANLLTNAAKFAGGGQVVVRARPRDEGRAVVLAVEDSGPGIPAAERERVFEAFYRGGVAQRNETPGSGLGLSLVRRIVRAHGGRVRIEDGRQGGAVVVVELPVADAEARG